MTEKAPISFTSNLTVVSVPISIEPGYIPDWPTPIVIPNLVSWSGIKCQVPALEENKLKEANGADL